MQLHPGTSEAGVQGWAITKVLAVVAFVVSLISSGLTALVGAYAKKKGESFATKQDFADALAQLRASTEAVESIKSSVATGSALAQELRVAAQKLTFAMASLIHSMCWLTWDAKSRGRLDQSLAARYDEEAHRLLPEIIGQLALVASYDIRLHDDLLPLADRVFWLDGNIGEAIVTCERDPKAGLERIRELHLEAAAFERSHRDGTARALNRHFAAPTQGGAWDGEASPRTTD